MDERLAAELASMSRTPTGCGEILAEHGWPGRSLVGEDGAEHAWLLAQHADQQLDLQRLALLTRAVREGEATATQLAYLTDRVRMNEGRPQLYVTQIMGMGEEGPAPWPVEDPDRLDDRRAGAGLEPFADYASSWGVGDPAADESPV